MILPTPSPFSPSLQFARTHPARLVLSLTLALLAAPFAHAADDTAAQRQLREDRERFQRKIERQRTEAAIQAERARQSADQQRTADELARLRAQQDRQASELRSHNANTRALTDSSTSSYTTRLRTAPPAATPAPQSPPISPSQSPLISPSSSPTPLTTPPPSSAPAHITPDFALTLLPDGRCILHVKNRPPEIKSPAEAAAALQQLLAPVTPSPGL